MSFVATIQTEQHTVHLGDKPFLTDSPSKPADKKAAKISRHLSRPPITKFNPEWIYQKGVKTYFILSFDGGGTRGVISLKLAELMEKEGNFSFLNADCYAGSSTGALISLGLTQMPISDILDRYKNGMKEVFSIPFLYRVSTFFGLRGSIYPKTGLSKLLDGIVGEKKISDTDKDLVITAYDENEEKGFVFSHFDEESTVSMKEAALASTAAKVYFTPEEVEGRLLIDGGFYANNPSQVALNEAWENRKPDQETQIFVLSIGTGLNPKVRKTIGEARNTFVFENITETIDDLLMSQSDTVMDELEHDLIDYDNVHFLRLQPKLDQYIPLDDTDPKTVEKMEQIALDYFTKLMQKGFKQRVLDPIHALFNEELGKVVVS